MPFIQYCTVYSVSFVQCTVQVLHIVKLLYIEFRALHSSVEEFNCLYWNNMCLSILVYRSSVLGATSCMSSYAFQSAILNWFLRRPSTCRFLLNRFVILRGAEVGGGCSYQIVKQFIFLSWSCAARIVF